MHWKVTFKPELLASCMQFVPSVKTVSFLLFFLNPSFSTFLNPLGFEGFGIPSVNSHEAIHLG